MSSTNVASAHSFAAADSIVLGPGAIIFSGVAAAAEGVIAIIEGVLADAPPRRMEVPGGHRMSVAMSNCGSLGWTADRHGYRYTAHDPEGGRRWPPLPEPLSLLASTAAAAAGFAGFTPDCCLINRYAPGARMGLHQDRDERDLSAPIVSLSLGLPARFLWGGLRRRDRPRRIVLAHGDVLVFGGASRLVFHGVEPLADGEHPATGRWRINLTFRKAA